MMDEMHYLNAFFENLPFFKSINNKNNGERLFTYLRDSSNLVLQQEIDEWLKIAYEHKIVDDFKKRLSGNITSIDLSCILNELMVAHFVHTMLNMRIKQYSPAVKDNKMADWLFEKYFLLITRTGMTVFDDQERNEIGNDIDMIFNGQKISRK